jgi:hypothetical protein
MQGIIINLFWSLKPPGPSIRTNVPRPRVSAKSGRIQNYSILPSKGVTSANLLSPLDYSVNYPSGLLYLKTSSCGHLASTLTKGQVSCWFMIMEWTKEKPIDSGFYCFFTEGCSWYPQICEIKIYHFDNDENPVYLILDDKEHQLKEFENCWWFGPLEVPFELLQEKIEADD